MPREPVVDIGVQSLRGAAAALRTRTVSSAELVDGVLRRMHAVNPRIGAITDVLAETAQAEARDIDKRRIAGEALGDIAGIPVVVKDIIDTTPAICSAGLSFLANYRPARDATVTAQLRQAGAIIVGVSATDPGAFGVRTPAVTHPQAPERTVGGSSGGSAAALAAGFCFAALGTDTGGSIRIPSACCMTSGFKPSLGRVSTRGVRPLVWSLDHVGPMTRRAADIPIIQRILDPDCDATASTRASGPLVVGHDPSYYVDAAPEVIQGMERAREACSELGAEIQEVKLPSPDEVLAVHRVIFCSEAAAYHFEAFPGRLSDYPDMPRRLLELAGTQTGHDYVRATRRRDEMRSTVRAQFARASFLLAPTLPLLAPPKYADRLVIGGSEHDFTLGLIRYTCLFDHTGNPVVSLPVAALGPGIGVSVQVIGPLQGDADTVDFAMQLEAKLDLAPDFNLVCSSQEATSA